MYFVPGTLGKRLTLDERSDLSATEAEEAADVEVVGRRRVERDVAAERVDVLLVEALAVGRGARELLLVLVPLVLLLVLGG